MDVEDDDQGRNHEEHLEDAAWQNWALVLVGFAVIFVFTVVAWVSRLSFLIAAHVVSPLLGEQAELFREHDVVNEDVSIGKEVDEGDQWLAEAEEEEE